MTRSSYFFGLGLLFYSLIGFTLTDNSRIAFYYGANPPLDELHAFNRVIVHPDQHVSASSFNTPNSQLIAYVSIGELEPGVSYEKLVNRDWYIGLNSTWKSRIMDLSNPAWRDFLVNKLIPSLWKTGYRGFFLDTLDSYQLLHLSDDKAKAQQAGLIDIIKQIKKNYPEAEIITNRGFELLGSVSKDINAVAAESLFEGWNNDKKQYEAVSDANRKWLLNQLNTIHTQYHLPVIVIDYVSPNDKERARKTAKKIEALGFIPWVSDPLLETLGVGTIEVIPRKILMLYNVSESYKEVLDSISVFTYLAFPMEFMGFVPELLQLGKDNLPEGNLSDRYAGVVTWFSVPLVKEHVELEKFIAKQVDNHVPIVFMQNLGIPTDSPLYKKLNLIITDRPEHIKTVSLEKKDPSLEYEIKFQTEPAEFFPLVCKQCNPLLTLASGKYREDVIALTQWGGYVLAPYDISVFPSGESRWFVNPFDFFKKALRLPTIPVPDVTTVNGRRILTTHIDGDGFISLVPWKTDTYSGELIYQQILQRYLIPATVSFIQREFEIIQKSPELAERLLAVAKDIANLPWVHLASHTYSHPLKWGNLVEGELNTSALAYPDPNYKFDYQKEIGGSIDFINSHIAPPGKKADMMFWSGDAVLLPKPLELTEAKGLLNINGKAALYTNTSHSISVIAPYFIKVKNSIQVFAPIANDFQFTDNWARPMYTFDKVIHNFELTEKPIRLRPISIYYHFYSATEQGAMRALHRIYDWALTQRTAPIYIKEYAAKVLNFRTIALAKFNNGDWLVANNNAIKEFRLPKLVGFPNFTLSTNILGFNEVNGEHYFHLGSDLNSVMAMTPSAPSRPYLVDTNSAIANLVPIDDKNYELSLQAYVPLEFKLANLQHCEVLLDDQILSTDSDGNYKIEGLENGKFKIQCVR